MMHIDLRKIDTNPTWRCCNVKIISLKQWFIYSFSLLKKRQIQFSYLAELYLGKGSDENVKRKRKNYFSWTIIYLFTFISDKKTDLIFLSSWTLSRKGSKAAKVVVNEDDTFFAACRLAGPILGWILSAWASHWLAIPGPLQSSLGVPWRGVSCVGASFLPKIKEGTY